MKGRPATGMTRRAIGRTLLAAAPAAAAFAQQPPAEDLVASARDQAKRTSETLRSFKVPIATEPSFAFRP